MVNEIFQTSSLNIVAWLMTKGYEVSDRKKINNRTIFYFNRDEKLQSYIDQYNNNADLKDFIAKFRIVKDMAKKD